MRSAKPHPAIGPMSANSAANLRARSGVRLAIITSAQFALQQRTEHAAHGAARAENQERSCRPGRFPDCARGRPCRPRPSVLSPSREVSSKKAMVLTACARSARGVSSLTSSAAACLWGSVTFRPRTPPVNKRRASRRKFSGDDVEQPVHQVLGRCLGKHAVDERRPTVGDGVAHDPVLIRRVGSLHRTHSLSHSAARLAK